MDYKQKYLKYKTKYLQLKEQLGGSFLSRGYNWMKKKASDKYDCYMKGHSRICNGLLDAYLKNIKQSGDILKKALQKEYETLVEEHNNNVYETATDEEYNKDMRGMLDHEKNEHIIANYARDAYEQVQRTKIYVGKFYDYLAECINQKCVSIDWNKYPGLIDFLESDFCLKQAGTSNENKTLKISFDNRQKNLDQTAIDNWNKPKKETKEENNNNTTKENNDTKEENKGLYEKQQNIIRTKGFSEGPEPDDELILGGSISNAINYFKGTCNEIHEKINAIYQNYKSKDENSADAQMGGEFTRIRTKYFILKNKEIMTQDEIDIYNEIKPYDFNWNKYKEKLKEKNFCVEKKQ